MHELPGQSAVKTKTRRERDRRVPLLRQEIEALLLEAWRLDFKVITFGKGKIDLEKIFGEERASS